MAGLHDVPVGLRRCFDVHPHRIPVLYDRFHPDDQQVDDAQP
ncbi:MAG: hypothetical protein AAF488_13230 [Planctomycetota bacterium]